MKTRTSTQSGSIISIKNMSGNTKPLLTAFIKAVIQINENRAMKLPFLLILLFFVHTAHTQVKDGNKTRQIEQLQQLKETITRKIDTLHYHLTDQADSIEGLRKKLDQLKRENNSQDKPDMGSKEQAPKLSQELLNMTNAAYNLKKKYELGLATLDKAVNLQRGLDDKIVILVRESNQ